MISPATEWLVAGAPIDISGGVLVGILNVTPDSFTDGGAFRHPGDAVAHGLTLVAEGASLVDVGGESTRPGAAPVDEDEELRRLLPAIEGLVAEGVALSVDTYKPAVARRALAEGVRVVNDVTGFSDEAMVEVAASSDCGVVAMHMRGTPADMAQAPPYEDVVAEVEGHLLESARRLMDAGVARERIALDPGIGFGKRAKDSLRLLAGLDRLAGHGFPVMIGTSRKGFIGRLIGSEDLLRRDQATAATTALGYALGARLFRAHDVALSRDALRVSAAIVADQ